MKKVFSLFLAFPILFTGPLLAFAEDLPPPPQEEPQPEPDPQPLPEPEPQPEPKEEQNLPEEPDPFGIKINEVLADSTEPDATGEFIELYNSGNQALDLKGWVLDDENLVDKYFYTFKNPNLNYLLEPGHYLTFFRPETKITLNNEGDTVNLFNSQKDEIDSFTFESTSMGRPWGRNPQNPDEWILFPTPTPDAENVLLNNPPVAAIHVQGGTGGMKINVTGEDSTDPDGDALTYLWEFEPGIFSEAENPLTYTFQSPGNKILKLKVTDEFGLFAEATLPFIAAQENQPPPNDDEEVDEDVDEPLDPVDPDQEEADELPSEPLKTYPQLHLLNEFMPDPPGADGEGEWVELYNPTDQTVDLSGWYLDDEEGASAPFKIPEKITLNAKSYLVFQGADVNLSLKNSADTVRLLDPNKIETQRVNYVDSKEGLSYAKSAQDSFLWTSMPTPKAVNAFPPPPKAYSLGVIRFDSVLPNPEGTDTGKEKILLKNTSGESINLSGWKLATSSTEKELLSVLIPANSKKELVSSEFGVTLKNTNETLRLLDPTGQMIDEISWKTSSSDQWLFNTNSLQNGMLVAVNEVVDGDTFKMTFEGKPFTVRLLGVDTPETVHPFKPVEFYGKQASDYLKNLLMGKQVRLNFDENKLDAYGRVLAYVYSDDLFVNAEVVKQGYGYAYTRYPFQSLTDFVAYQAEAKAAGRGLWENPEVAAEIEKTIQEGLAKPEELGQNGALVDLEDDPETIKVEQDSHTEEAKTSEDESLPDSISSLECDSEFLKIDSFLPAPKSGEEEYIKLINTGEQEACLAGWKLDDVLESGSKPFQFQNGQIKPGEIQEFKKTITKLSFNNSNDCVSLINPLGELADQICYEKTHENEVFTHTGGNGISTKSTPTPSATKKKTTTKSTAVNSKASPDAPKHTFNRESSSYRSELTNRSFLGRIIGMDEDEMMLVVELEDQKIIPISYAHSLFDMKMIKALLKLDKLLMFDVYQTADFAQLVDVYDPDDLRGAAPEKSPVFYILFALPTMALLMLAWKKRALLKSIKWFEEKID